MVTTTYITMPTITLKTTLIENRNPVQSSKSKLKTSLAILSEIAQT